MARKRTKAVLLIVLKAHLFAQLTHIRSTNILLSTRTARCLDLCTTNFADAAKFKSSVRSNWALFHDL